MTSTEAASLSGAGLIEETTTVTSTEAAKTVEGAGLITEI